MPKNNETTAKFKLDISELTKGIQAAKRQIALANASFKSATAGMDDWSKSASGIGEKLTQLKSVLSGQQKILDGLEEQYRLTAKEMGADSKAAENLKIKIENQKAAIAKTQKQIGQYETALSEMGSESKQSESAIDKLSRTIGEQEDELKRLKKAYSSAVLEYGENSREARNLAKQIGSLSSELADNKKEMDKVDKSADELDNSLDDLDDSAKGAEDGFTVLKGAIATFAGNMATQFVGAVKSGIGYLAGLADETREFRQDMATLNTAFDEAGFSAEQATGTWKDLYAVFGEDDRAVEAANNISRMAKNQQELDEWVRITTGIWGTYQDALPVEGLAEAAGETAKTGQVTGVLADALNWSSDAAEMFAGYMSEDVTNAEDAFNEALKECTTEQERQALITDTLTKLYGDAGDKYEETAGDIMDANKATADLTMAQAAMADKMEPIVAIVKQGFADILSKILEVTEGVDFEAFAGQIKAAFDTFINETLPKIIEGLQWVLDNKDTIIAGIVGIGAAFMAWKVVGIIQGIVAATKAWIVATEGMTVAQRLLNLVMKANPIGIVISLVTALVAAFIILWNKSEAFREFWIGLWEKIKKGVGDAITAIGKFFSNLWSDIQGVWGSVSGWFNTNVIQPVSNFFSGLVSTVSGFFSNLWAGIKKVWSTASGWFNNTVIQPIVNFFTNLFNSVKNIFTTLWSAIVTIFSPAIEWFSSLFSSIYNTLKSVIDVAVGIIKGCWEIICTVFGVAADWFNKNVIQPVADFFKKMWENISMWAKNAWTAVSNAFKAAASWFNTKVIQPVVNFFKGLWDKVKNGAKDAWTAISNAFKSAATWFNDKIITPVSNFFSGMWSKLKSGASDAWSGIKNVFSNVTGWFKDKFSAAWTAVKNVFSTGGKIFSGIKEGIEKTFKTVVNGIIGGINTVISKPFNAINGMLNKIRNASFLGISPFKNKWSQNPLSVPQIPLLYQGGVLEKGKLGLLEGKGTEAVVPLENNKKWINKTAKDLKASLQSEGIIGRTKTASNNVTNNYNFVQNNTSPKALSRLDIYRQTRNQLAFAKGV